MLTNQKGFTLIEMLIVLLIISVLLMLTIPNVANYNSMIENKGCEAYEDLLQSEVQMFKIENGDYPTDLTQLDSVDETNLNTCLEGKSTEITDGNVDIGP